MGSSCSSFADLSKNNILIQLCGCESINNSHPYWNTLLSFSIQQPLDSAHARLLLASVAGLCKDLAINNCKTGNFGTLVKVFLVRSQQLQIEREEISEELAIQTYNALFIIRVICQYFVERLTQDVILQEFDAVSQQEKVEWADENGDSSLCEVFLSSLMTVLVDIPVSDCTYGLHLEAVNTLITLLSTHMFEPRLAKESHILQFVMEGRCSLHAYLGTKRILLHYIQQFQAPTSYFPTAEISTNSGLLSSLSTSLWRVATLNFSKDEKISFPNTPLAQQSLCLLLVLCNCCTSMESGLHNPYREALVSFTNITDDGGVSVVSRSFRLDVSVLYETLCQMLPREEGSTLILYTLLHENVAFRAFVFSRTELQDLVVPLLKILYFSESKSSHHVYMSLIVLLILTEDPSFNAAVFQLNVKDASWYEKLSLNSVSLGSLTVLVLLRAIQLNMCRLKDKYLHTNCLAALANMAPYFSNLHQHAAQRFMDVFCILAKRHRRLLKELENASASSDIDGQADLTEELSLLEEVLRMMIEIFNACFTHALSGNIHLVYSLLYNTQKLDDFRTHPAFQDLLQNIDQVLLFFNTRLKSEDNVSVTRVLQVITDGALQFPRDRLKKFPELKFKYVEEEQPEDFFVPYVWSLVHQAGILYFSSERIRIFAVPETGT